MKKATEFDCLHYFRRYRNVPTVVGHSVYVYIIHTRVPWTGRLGTECLESSVRVLLVQQRCLRARYVAEHAKRPVRV